MSTVQASAKTVWQIDPSHTHVEFAAKHMMIATVKGRFAEVSGSVVLDEGDLANSSVEVTMGAASIDTRQEQRDEHLRSADFLDVATHPTLTFKSTRIEAAGEGEFRVIGDLTIRGVTREVTLNATDEGRGMDPWGGERMGFSAKTVIDRRDFGLVWNAALETGGVLVGNEVKISLEVEVVKSAA
jgi:polyisoprenoid-binding protein YceI